MDDQTKIDEIENMNADIQTALDGSLPDYIAAEAWAKVLPILRKYDAGIEWIKPVYQKTPPPEMKPEYRTDHSNPVEDEKRVIRFGKHNGKTLGEIIDTDPGYFNWLVESNAIRDPGTHDAAGRIYSRNA